MDRAERIERLHHLHAYGATQAAMHTAEAIINHLPDPLPAFGIYPLGEEHTPCGITLERSSAQGGACIEINTQGHIESCYLYTRHHHEDIQPDDAKHAAHLFQGAQVSDE